VNVTSDAKGLPAVEHSVRVSIEPAAAFELFTQRISTWWPFKGHSCFGEEALDVLFEPFCGGTVTEVARDGARMPWGTLIEWSPPDGFAMRWFPGLDDQQATLLRVRFVAVAGGTLVSVHHSDWEGRGAQAAAKREQYDGGWPATLAAFRVAAEHRTGEEK
jgi:hypothetical protein